MQKNLMYFDENILKEVFDEKNRAFLVNLNNKQIGINEELKNIKIKKQDILDKILEDKKILKKNTREYREYIGNSESSLESVDLICKNLNEIKEKYINIEKNLVEIENNHRVNLSLNDLKEKIIEEISNAVILEEKIKEDNEKNYLIINSFIENYLDDGTELQTDKKFYDLTLENLEDNAVLKICEKRVELPYTKKEIEDFMQQYPEEYKTVQDVIAKEFMISISMFSKHPILARFKEAYYLCRTKEMMTILESFNYAKNLMFKSEINPYIIAAVKSKKQLEDYIECLEENKLEEYPHFKIIFEVNPFAV